MVKSFDYLLILVVPVIVSIISHMLLAKSIPVSILYCLCVIILCSIIYGGFFIPVSVGWLCFWIWKIYGLPGTGGIGFSLICSLVGVIALQIYHCLYEPLWRGLDQFRAKVIIGIISALYVNTWILMLLDCENKITLLFGSKWLFIISLILLHLPLGVLIMSPFFILILPVVFLINLLFSKGNLMTIFWNYITLGILICSIQLSIYFLCSFLGLIGGRR